MARWGKRSEKRAKLERSVSDEIAESIRDGGDKKKKLLTSEKYSNFAFSLAALYRGASQGYIQAHLNKIYDLMEGVKDNMFAEDTAPKHLKEAIREVFGIEYGMFYKLTY